MKSWIVVVCMLVSAFAFCAVEEIPATTSSKQALDSFNKGLYYLDVGRALEARTEFLKAVQADPAFSHGYFYLSLSALSIEEFKQSLDKAKKSVEGKSEGENILIEINRTFIDNDAGRRVHLAQALVQKYPQAPRAWLRLGFAQGSINHHQEARKAFDKAMELDPKLIGTPVALLFSYLFNEPRDFDKAKLYAEKCIQLQPKEAKCYELQGDVFRARNELKNARDSYTKALQIDPGLHVAGLKKGHINSFLGHYDEARTDYDKAIAGTEKVNKTGYSNFRAMTYLHAGQPKVALKELQKLVDSADSFGLPKEQSDAAKLGTLNNELLIALHLNSADDAQKVLNQIQGITAENIKRMNDEDYARQQNANLALLQGQIAARKKDFRTAETKAEENKKLVESDSSPRKLEGYYGLLATIELLQGNHAKAVELYEKADQTILYVKYQYGLALEGAGKTEESSKIFGEVANYNFNLVDFALARNDSRVKRFAKT
ncbi:tetratricopeptide repeat protein [bacterium]|nr:tetratricopeptide repeat protein [bacterium]